ncbi:MAG: aspartate ammonia-lyase [Desulfuromonadia bacterium]
MGDGMTRIERDTLGEVAVPSDALYGAQTKRAVDNFPISGLKPFPSLVHGTVAIKRAAAIANRISGRLPERIADAIVTACDEALDGKMDDQFVVDPFQAGAGTSHNMNVNEVIANRAGEILGGVRGEYRIVHPNDHVNMSQSTNDVFPTAVRLAVIRDARRLSAELSHLAAALGDKGVEFADVVKSGRTHLQDAVPITLGQEFSAWARSVWGVAADLERTLDGMYELGIGGTAVGTGLNADREYVDRVVAELADATGFPLRRGGDLIERMENMNPFLTVSAALRGVAVVLGKIANDLRLLASGPRTGLDEIRLPAVQPGSSIMPGKVNPSMAEMLNMVCFQVIGCDTAVTHAVAAGQLELNVMMPLIAYDLLFSLSILANAVRQFRGRCIEGITANRQQCRRYFESSLGLVTILAPRIGYHRAAEIAREADQSGESIVEVIRRQGIVTDGELSRMLDPDRVTRPGVIDPPPTGGDNDPKGDER